MRIISLEEAELLHKLGVTVFYRLPTWDAGDWEGLPAHSPSGPGTQSGDPDFDWAVEDEESCRAN